MPGAMTPREQNVINKIETRQGPVGKGHHNSHRTAALLKWLREKEAQGKGGKTPPTPPAKGQVPPQFQKKSQAPAQPQTQPPAKGKNPIPPQFLKGK